ncbi:DUF2911 domain-containing protein [Balneola vulgaris]|uniref:DUF2911 domain-containing protein n=1 Tax=Balneola vulgaris TaxID=287535 RepID=UPI000371D0E0|nr:DUF2911 domain-containing protein [Balneola vulgaris]
MKTLFKLGTLLFVAVLLTTEFSIAQERGKGNRPSPNAAVSQDIGSTTVAVTYGRPGLKGRALSSLAPAGKVWRTGANESAAITFSSDVMFGDKEVAAGTYSLYSIPGDKWTFILNKKLSWGTQYDMSQDVIRVEAAVTSNDAPMMERFSIYFDTLSDTKAHLNLHWGTTMAAIPITVK